MKCILHYRGRMVFKWYVNGMLYYRHIYITEVGWHLNGM